MSALHKVGNGEQERRQFRWEMMGPWAMAVTTEMGRHCQSEDIF